MTERFFIDNGDGWKLSLFCTRPATLKHTRPVLIVPGYGMNSFIFSFHPRGTSIESEFVAAGYEFWRIDLRCQGESFSSRPDKENVRLEDWAVTDLTAVLEAIVARTATGAKTVDVLGASLGGSLVLAHAVLVPNNRVGAIVTIGSPVRWLDVHPFARFATMSPRLFGGLRIAYAREISLFLLPLLARTMPKLLSIYLNPDHTDLTKAEEMVRTVENPLPSVNRQIAEWIQTRELYLHGRAIGDELRHLKNPLLAVTADGDGLVPPKTARFAYEVIGSDIKDVLAIADPERPWGHADLFIANQAPEVVFPPIMKWLIDLHEIDGVDRRFRQAR